MRFLNTYIDNLTATEAKRIIDKYLQDGKIHYIVTPNTDIVVKMQDDEELRYICGQADLILTDGQILVKLSRILGQCIKERVCMTDFIWHICDLAVEKKYKVFLFGGKSSTLITATENIKKKYPRLNIVGTYSPPFGFETKATQLEKANKIIRESNADILIVFLGCPKQEKFIYYNKEKYRVPVSITMGGCVDFMAGNVKRAPIWMQDIGLEWFYRFLQEPKRLFKRYFIDDMRILGIALKYKKVYSKMEDKGM